MPHSSISLLKEMVDKYKLFENAIVFNGVDDPYFNISRVNEIYKKELSYKKQKKINEINVQIEIAEEEENARLIDDLIFQRKNIRNLQPRQINSIEDAQFPSELDIDLTKFTFI